jgi:hypothetical protein
MPIPAPGRFLGPKFFNLRIRHIKGFKKIIDELQFFQRWKTGDLANQWIVAIDHGSTSSWQETAVVSGEKNIMLEIRDVVMIISFRESKVKTEGRDQPLSSLY